MTTTTKPVQPSRWPKKWLAIAGVGSISLIAVLFILSAVGGFGLNIRAFGRAVVNVIQAIRNQPAANAHTGDFRNIIFLHHSVGHNLIEQGSVRELFAQAGYRFWDHDYNYLGLSDPSGNNLGYSYNVPADNTDPDGLFQIFSQPVFGLPINTLSSLLQHEVIAFKSCFPASHIASDAQLEERKTWYLKMRDVMDQHPEHVFVVITQPPLNPAETDPAAARRARAFADWLAADDYTHGHPNIFVYNLFGMLAENDPTVPDFGMLRDSYREGTDSHPTLVANQKIGPQLVEFIMQSVEQFKSSR